MAAYASSAAHAHQSPASPAWSVRITSGSRYAAVPITSPVEVSRDSSAAMAMPKSMITGSSRSPSGSKPVRSASVAPRSMTLLGLRSRWITPASWIACRVCPRTSAISRTASGCSPPWVRTASSSVGPGTNSVTTKASEDSSSASRIRTMLSLRTSFCAATSRASLSRARASSEISWRSSLIATSLPSASCAR